MKKKDLPIDVLKVLEKYVTNHGVKYIRVDDANRILNFIDVDEESDFYFILHQYKDKKFYIGYKPYSTSTIEKLETWISISELDNHFHKWLNLLNEYSKTNSIFDDSILKSFEEEFYADFEILDEDKDKPLENDKILLLDEYLENLVKGLETHKTEENKNKIEEIQANIIFLQESLTQNSRQEIAQKVSKIFAKIKKLGVKYLKEFISQGTKELISQGVKYLIENSHTFIK